VVCDEKHDCYSRFLRIALAWQRMVFEDAERDARRADGKYANHGTGERTDRCRSR